MPVRYIASGDEFKAKQILGKGRHQLSILKNLMSFQNLQQLQRTVKFNDGTEIKVSSFFGQDIVNVFVPFGIPVFEEVKVIAVDYCWCTDYFTLGKIIEILGEYGNVGEYGEEIYPDYCNISDTDVKNYNGIRYKVSLCQGNDNSQYICLPSDFAEYKVNDKVIVFMRGIWDNTSLDEPPSRDPKKSCINDGIDLCIACEGIKRKNQTRNEADGSYLIMPLEIAGIN